MVKGLAPIRTPITPTSPTTTTMDWSGQSPITTAMDWSVHLIVFAGSSPNIPTYVLPSRAYTFTYSLTSSHGSIPTHQGPHLHPHLCPLRPHCHSTSPHGPAYLNTHLMLPAQFPVCTYKYGPSWPYANTSPAIRRHARYTLLNHTPLIA